MKTTLQKTGNPVLCAHSLTGIGTMFRLNNGSEIGIVAHDVATLNAAANQLNPDDHRPLLVSRMRHVLLSPQDHSYLIKRVDSDLGEIGNIVNTRRVYPLTCWWELEGADIYEPDLGD